MLQVQDFEDFKRDFKKLFNKDFDEDLSAFIGYINSVKMDGLKIILVQLSEHLKNKNI